MAIGLIIIGDEILSGKRSDAHFSHVVGLLKARGLQLAWADYLGDDPQRIAATLARTFASDDIVFCCGGIGATPDDHTRQAAATALGRPLLLHPQAAALIEERMADVAREKGQPGPDMASAENRQRLKMAEFAEGAALIPNPYNKIAGFALGQHYFVPGFPVMAWPMLEWVLDTHYSHLVNLAPEAEQALLVYGQPESALTPLMETLEQRYAPVKVFSLPSVGTASSRPHIELGVKGAPALLADAFGAMCGELDRIGAEYVRL